MAFWTVLLKFWNQFAKPIFIAHHESHGRVVALNEVVEVERLSEDKEAATEGVGLSDADDYAILKQPAGTLKYMAPEQKERGAKIDGRTDIYAFGLLLREVFPHRYRHIAAKCSRQDRERRYANVEAVKKAFDRRLRWLWMLPVLIGLVLAVIPSIFIKPKEIVRTEVQYINEKDEDAKGTLVLVCRGVCKRIPALLYVT